MKQHNFKALGFSAPELEALEELRKIEHACKQHLSVVLQFPEFHFLLDLASRSCELRQFKHIHQMCLIHATHFEMANQIKSTYMLNSYLSAAEELNPIAVYSGLDRYSNCMLCFGDISM